MDKVLAVLTSALVSTKAFGELIAWQESDTMRTASLRNKELRPSTTTLIPRCYFATLVLSTVLKTLHLRMMALFPSLNSLFIFQHHKGYVISEWNDFFVLLEIVP